MVKQGFFNKYQSEEVSKITEEIKKVVENIEITKNAKIVFFLGAGASAPSGIPTTDYLLNELYKAAKMNNQKELLDLFEYCNETGINNIEDVLSVTYILNFIESNENVVNLLMYLLEIKEITTIKKESTIEKPLNQILYSLLARIMLTAKPNEAHKAIATFIKLYPENVSVITTNYDCLMEEALLNEGISAEIIKEIVTKMHGSINWWYCKTCHNQYEQNTEKLKDVFGGEIPYPVLGVCPNCSGITEPLIILPYSFKFVSDPKIIDMWCEGKRRIENADIAIVIGYSFPEGDKYLTEIFLQMLMKSDLIVVIINKSSDAAEKLKDKVEFIFDENIAEKKVKTIEGDCRLVVPLLIRELLNKINTDDY